MKTAEQRAKELVAQMTLTEKLQQLLYNAPAIERLGVPEYNWWNEALHGVGRAGVATVFPQSIALAATFDKELMEEVAAVISDEVRAKHHAYARHGDYDQYKGLTCWSPNINLFRDPRWGRGHETYGEDPYLTAEMGIAFVRGMQGEDPGHRKVDATVKHYAVHSGPETERHRFDARVSEKDLRETYLYAFERCVKEARPAAVMGAYNRVYGEPCCASPRLLGEILRGEWGFEGYVVSDCGALCDFHEHHHVTSNKAESAALALNNGCDLNCGHAFDALMAAVQAGLVTEETVTRSVERLFTARFNLGMFDPPEEDPYAAIPYETVDCPEHRALSLRAAEEGIVLLKNDGILPLSGGLRNVAVIGPNCDDKSLLVANYNGTPSSYVTLLEGIRRRLPAGCRLTYAEGCHSTRLLDDGWAHPYTEAVIAAENADVVILCIGLTPQMEGEEGDAYNSDAGGDKATIRLPRVQRGLLEALSKTGKPIVCVHVSGSAMSLCEADALCNAVVQVFYPGEEGGTALARVLFGDVNPSGRLPLTFYRSDDDLPPFEDYAMENRTYRYFGGDPLYPFGFGLSYTTYSYCGRALSNTQIAPGGQVELRVRVKNTGSRAGEEVVQVYVQNRNADCTVPRLRLARFARVALRAGEEQEVRIPLTADDLRYYNTQGEAVLTPGECRIFVGGGQPGADDEWLSIEILAE